MQEGTHIVIDGRTLRGIRKLATGALRIVLAAMWFALVVQCALAVQTTQVADTVYLADGTPASGTVLISWPTFTTAAGEAVPAGSTTVMVGADGALRVALAPNQGATPEGAYYTVVMHLNGGAVSNGNNVTTEYWVVPALQTVQAGQAGLAGQAGVVGATGATAPTTTLGAIRSKVIPVTRAVPLSGGLASTAGLVEKSGDTMQGPLTLSGDPVAPTQATTKQYVDAGMASQQVMISAATTLASGALPKSGSYDVNADCGLKNDGVKDNYALWTACSAAHPTGTFVWAGGGAYYFSRDIYQAANQIFVGKGSCYNATTGVPVCGSTLMFAADSAGLHQQGGAKMTDMNIVGGNPAARQSGATDMGKLIIPDGQYLNAFADVAVAMSRAGNVVTATTTYGTWFVKNGIIKVTGATPSSLNGTFYITSATPVGSQSQITWDQTGPDVTASVAGTIRPGTTGAAHGSGLMVEGSKVIDTNISISNFANNCFEVTGSPYYTPDVGVADAYVVNPLPAFPSYSTTMEFAFMPANTSSSAAPTVNVNGLGVKAITDGNGNPLASGALAAGGIYYLFYNSDGTFHASGNEANLLISDDTQFTDSWTSGCGVAGLAVLGASDTSKGTYNHINNYFNQVYGLLGVPFLGDTYNNIQNSYDALAYWPYGGETVPLTSISTVAGLATVTTATPHGYKQGNGVIFGGTNQTSFNNYEVDTGAANAIVLTPSTPMGSYTVGAGISFAAAFANTSATPTINVSGLGAKTLTDANGAALAVGAIAAFNNYGNIYRAIYDADGTFRVDVSSYNLTRITVSCFISAILSPTSFQCQLPSDASTAVSAGGTVKLANGDEILKAFGADTGSYSVGRHGYAGHNLVIANYTEGGQGAHNLDGCSVRFNESSLVLQPHSGDCITGGSIIQSDVNYGLQLNAGVLTLNASTFHFKPSGAPSLADAVTIDASLGNITAKGIATSPGNYFTLPTNSGAGNCVKEDGLHHFYEESCSAGVPLMLTYIGTVFNEVSGGVGGVYIDGTSPSINAGSDTWHHSSSERAKYFNDILVISDAIVPGTQYIDATSKDVTITAHYLTGLGAQLIARYTDDSNYVSLAITAGNLYLISYVAGVQTNVATRPISTADGSGTWVLTVNGNSISGSVNGLALSGTLAGNLTATKVGFNLFSYEQATGGHMSQFYVNGIPLTGAVYTVTVTPAAVAAASCADQTVTVTGLLTTDMLSQIAPPSALGNVSLSGYASAADSLTLHFCNVSVGSVIPPAGVYSFRAMR